MSGRTQPKSDLDHFDDQEKLRIALAQRDMAEARVKDLEASLQVAQELFDIMVNPQDHPNTSVLHLWAQCREIECEIRDLLQPKDGAK